MGSLLGVSESASAEFSFFTPSAPPSTYAFKLTGQAGLLPVSSCLSVNNPRLDSVEHILRTQTIWPNDRYALKDCSATRKSAFTPALAKQIVHARFAILARPGPRLSRLRFRREVNWWSQARRESREGGRSCRCTAQRWIRRD